MIRGKAKFRRSRIAGIVWFAGLAVLLLFHWWIMANFVIRNFWDPSYAKKSECLRARVGENPQRPLWLVLGSSRVEFGLRPDVLADETSGKNAPLIFNFGLSGAGVFREYIYLHRLLEDGFMPRRVGIEIFEPDLKHELFASDEVPQMLVRARRDEFDDYFRYSNIPPDFINQWNRSRWDPAYQYGMRMPHQTLSLRLIPLPGIKHLEQKYYDKWGWVPMAPATSEQDYQAAFAVTKGRYAGDYVDFKVAPKADLVIRRILDMCKNAGIEVFFLKMPESADFRAMHTAQSDAALASYIAEIQTEYSVPLVDGSTWIAKAGFTDGHHLNGVGGAVFTRRLAGEIFALKPRIINGRPQTIHP